MKSVSPRALVAVVGYLLLYALSLARLAAAPGFEVGETVGVMLVLGLGLSFAAWLATRAVVPWPSSLRSPAPEVAAIVGYLALFAVLVLGWGLSAVRETVSREPLQSAAILGAKLATMVLVPGWLFTRFGYSWGRLFSMRRFDRVTWRALAIMAVLLLALQIVAGRGLQTLSALHLPVWHTLAWAPAALAWMTLEAGITEEFLFRVLLQTRLAVWLESETAGILSMALLFGLAHAPGYVLRGAHAMEGMGGPPSVPTALAYAVAVVSPVGIAFGVLLARTRNLLLLVLLHGWADLLPNLAPFILAWTKG